jgi:hypothetical protein
MKIQELASTWGKNPAHKPSVVEFRCKLSIQDAAKIAALQELYADRTESEIISDLLCAALREVESSLPYVQGENIIGQDELGDPRYEDIGPTPRYIQLMRKHFRSIRDRYRLA